MGNGAGSNINWASSLALAALAVRHEDNESICYDRLLQVLCCSIVFWIGAVRLVRSHAFIFAVAMRGIGIVGRQVPSSAMAH
jgi:hypothetical protein